MPKKLKHRQLLVEGKNDQHVIWALCNQYQLPKPNQFCKKLKPLR